MRTVAARAFALNKGGILGGTAAFALNLKTAIKWNYEGREVREGGRAMIEVGRAAKGFQD